jgi:hypothetical protein
MLYLISLLFIPKFQVTKLCKIKSNIIFFIEDSQYVRGEVLSSGWIIKETTPGYCEFSYILQLGSKALTLALGDIVGDSKVIALSINNVRKHFQKDEI